jgi:hypothetical protein
LRVILLLIAGAALLVGACRAPAPPPREVVIWRPVGSWTGHGNMQTGSFTSDSGSFRVQWETSNESPAGTGTFRVTLHSAISGRPLLTAADHHGVGQDTVYLHEDPRVSYFVIESANLDWSVAAEEAIVATITPTPSSPAAQTR